MNRLIKTILVLLFWNILFAQETNYSLERAVDINGIEFNAIEMIEIFKKEDKGPIARYYQMQGLTNIGDKRNVPVLDERKTPKRFLSQKTIDSRVSCNFLFGDNEKSKNLIANYFEDEQSGKLLLMFMFKECVHCKSDLPFLKSLMSSEFNDYSLKIITFSERIDIEKIITNYDLECDILNFAKDDIREEFDIQAYPRYLLFNENRELTQEFNSLKNINLSTLIKK